MRQVTSENAAVVAGGGEPPAGAPEAARRPLRELMDDRLLDALLERSRDQAGGLRLTGEGSMLGELIRAVLERALESELTAHLGYEKHERGRERQRPERGGAITEYHEELIARLRADIEAREHWQAAWAVPGTDESERAALTEVREVSRANAAWLSEQLQVAGWPLESAADTEAAEAAWAIAQHADHDPAFQAHCLELMRAAVAAGEAPAARLAYLEDRVRVALGRPQLYGTQEIQLPGKDWELLPVEDPARLNERRAAVGLPALDIAQIRNPWPPPFPGADTK